MKRLMMLVLVLFILCTGKVYAFDVSADSAHTNGYVYKEVYISTEDGYILSEEPVYTFMYNYHTKSIHREMAMYNSLYETDSPFLGLPKDPYYYYDDNGEKFNIYHPQLVKNINRSMLQNNNIPKRFQELSHELYKYNPKNNGDVLSYVRKVFDSKIGNVVEYHNYTSVNQIKVYFDDLSYFTITYDNGIIEYCEYSGKMDLKAAEQYAQWMSANIKMKDKEQVQIDDETIAFNYRDSKGYYTMFNMRNKYVTSYIEGDRFVVYLTINNINPKANTAG